MATFNRKVIMRKLALIFVLAAAQLHAQDCKTYFSVVWKDSLNNVKQGLSKDDAKWIREKMHKKYPGVCYSEPDPSVKLVFFVTMSQAHYSGTTTNRETHSEPINATVMDQNGNLSQVNGSQQVTTTNTVPQEFDYPVFLLSVETSHEKEKWNVVHSFQRRGICRTLYGMPVHCHTTRYIVEDAMKWVHKGGLTDPLQSVVASSN